MNEFFIEKVNQVIFRKFPELIGKKPKVTSQPKDTYLLIYQLQRTMADGPSIHESVRVTCNSNGDVLKISSSRG